MLARRHRVGSCLEGAVADMAHLHAHRRCLKASTKLSKLCLARRSTSSQGFVLRRYLAIPQIGLKNARCETSH